jgi:two-component system, OmpR family, sensor kinase
VRGGHFGWRIGVPRRGAVVGERFLRFRGIGLRLSIALLVVNLVALAIVYSATVPSLGSRLVAAREAALLRDARYQRKVYERVPLGPDFISRASAASDARATVLTQPPSGDVLSVKEDSRSGASAADIENDPVARRAAATHAAVGGVVTRAHERLAEAAVPLASDGTVLLLSAPLRAESRSAALISHRILLAAGAAVLAVLPLGYLFARILARRIGRLKVAERRIAEGQFDDPIEDPSSDDLGQLAQELETMRGQLARLDSARKEFIANASHELRTPLFSIGGFLEMLDAEELDRNTQRRFIQTTREQLDRLTRLSLDLLDLARLDVGRMPLSREPVRLSRVATLVVHELSAAAKKQRHRLDLSVRGDIVVLGDHEHIARIVRVFVENALRHTPRGTAISVIVSGADDGGRISVEDAGPGIPASEINLIFERFYRIEGSVASGSGLGLSLAQQLAALMDGRIDVNSKPGRTTFWLALPRHLPANQPGLETHVLA